jgi:hypothetical protein
MTIPRPFARKLVMRFSGKQGFPKEDEAIKALIDAFQRYSVSEAHAGTIAEDLQVESPYCPDVSNIRRVALATRPETRRRWDGCPHCGGTGFVERTFQRKGLPGVEHAAAGTCVAPCSCRAPADEALAYISDELGGGV